MAGDREGDDVDFVREAFASLRTRRLLLPFLLLALFLAACNFAMLSALPTRAQPDTRLYLTAFMVYLIGLLAFAVAVLRILNAGPRRPWQPDASLWLYGMALIASIFIGLMAEALVGGRSGLVAGLATGALAAAVRAPLAPWFTAIAVERPLPLRPGDFFQRFSAWLPALLLWQLLIVVPLVQLLAALNRALRAGAGEWFWPMILLFGLVGAVAELISLALASTAYRRVART